MARYKVGDKYLSEDEYEQHVSGNWKLGLFLIGAIVTGYFVNVWLSGFELAKGVRFTLVLIAAIPSGYLASKLSNFARVAFGLAILGIVGWLVLSVIWNML
ncbi:MULTISPECIES: hypothetical protein [Vibrio]|uniref:Uncharacterized protein n=1 Tax=Vibrio proteolyticus NBRC 13287 TaxID=1219065 RepID=U3BIR6_VIBPR|nr:MULTISPECIES: hypothetical protein [Vibrio]EGQ9275332.1 hypothetical protein [Vibrio parahaemolyticus]EGQ9712495.1 hypothetical protein [Vibrio parahaemolyticus]EGQ9799534.1 hypothetical protein [Vibrio parahaemolyticus]EIA0904544.1 hypothetical protein [Vibrio parahaemolyticus]EID0733581.1 hypothetical protein [Vibrio parahaemolyticus]